ncbi:hypothetical protein BJ138DRAFT_109888 [Hygrophoropsis aurantiaca]|uniref:Uncharacterized protein n=1 Tax=Hygrophoropsis aurantiaca TaxID=72124 RepID=A0ACB7ZSG2_9AGAM|nr:hypothetical protein BJ138DRAFT_109888 [Hygrophoropsis aurantiaca]
MRSNCALSGLSSRILRHSVIPIPATPSPPFDTLSDKFACHMAIPNTPTSHTMIDCDITAHIARTPSLFFFISNHIFLHRHLSMEAPHSGPQPPRPPTLAYCNHNQTQAVNTPDDDITYQRTLILSAPLLILEHEDNHSPISLVSPDNIFSQCILHAYQSHLYQRPCHRHALLAIRINPRRLSFVARHQWALPTNHLY